MNLVSNEDIIEIVKAELIKSNCSPLDINIFRKKGSFQISIVLYKDPLDLDVLSETHTALYNTLENAFEFDFSLELSSPGINRIFKQIEEYAIFINKKIRLVLASGEVITGYNKGIKENILYIINDEGAEQQIKISNIRKTKLQA